jgi:hypothetical protein
MLSIAAWLENGFPVSVLWGSVAVLCTGWPFVGLLFLPLGLHMIAHSYTSVASSKGSHWSAFEGVLQIATSVIVIVAIIQTLVLLLDCWYYGKWWVSMLFAASERYVVNLCTFVYIGRVQH